MLETGLGDVALVDYNEPVPPDEDAAPPDVVDDEMAAILAAKTGAERLLIAAGMYRSARRMIESELSARGSAAAPEELAAEVARRLSHGEQDELVRRIVASIESEDRPDPAEP